MDSSIPSSTRKRAHSRSAADNTAVKQPRVDSSLHVDVYGNPRPSLPTPTTSFVRVRLQLARFKGVFRIVDLPLTMNFAHLHEFILYVFGWSGEHAHQAAVYCDVELYSKAYREGNIKRAGRTPPIPQSMLEDDMPMAWQQQWWEWQNRDKAEYRVVPKIRKRPDYGFGDYVEPEKQDNQVVLWQIWHPKESRNVSGGEYSNAEIAIKYEYDLGASWEVHITLAGDGARTRYEEAYNLPIVITARGSAPIEDSHREYVPGELDGAKKAVNPLIFVPDTFARYLRGEVQSVTRRKELVIVERGGEISDDGESEEETFDEDDEDEGSDGEDEE